MFLWLSVRFVINHSEIPTLKGLRGVAGGMAVPSFWDSDRGSQCAPDRVRSGDRPSSQTVATSEKDKQKCSSSWTTRGTSIKGLGVLTWWYLVRVIGLLCMPKVPLKSLNRNRVKISIKTRQIKSMNTTMLIPYTLRDGSASGSGCFCPVLRHNTQHTTTPTQTHPLVHTDMTLAFSGLASAGRLLSLFDRSFRTFIPELLLSS